MKATVGAAWRARPATLTGLGARGRVVVLSTHLDDAVFSVGATMAQLSSNGHHVDVVTVFAGDPHDAVTLREPDRHAHFATTRQAVAQRRDEDRAACALLGVTPVWMDIPPGQAHDIPAFELAQRLQSVVAGADLLLAPGYPLVHPDHRALSNAVAVLSVPGVERVFYREQPYATWQVLNRRLGRSPQPADRPEPICRVDPGHLPLRVPVRIDTYRKKIAAMTCYRSQLRILRRLPRLRVIGHEIATGGELLAWSAEVGSLLTASNRGGSGA